MRYDNAPHILHWTWEKCIDWTHLNILERVKGVQISTTEKLEVGGKIEKNPLRFHGG